MWTRAALLSVLLWGCAEDDNQPPELLPLENVEFRVNESGEIKIRATDEDRDELGYTFKIDPPPITQTQGITARPTLTRISNNEALFTWTPGIADAGGERFRDYSLTFQVLDERGALDATTVNARVINDGGVAQSTVLRFVEPSGAGIAVDLAEEACVSFDVKIKADQVAEDEVLLELLPPTPMGATLQPEDRPAKQKRFNWCPTQAQLDESLSHLVEISARRVGGDERINKRFQVRFKRAAAADCPGVAPTISHVAPAGFEGALNYEIQATITDDVGFKSPPVLLYVISPPQDPRGAGALDTSAWALVEFSSGQGDGYTAEIPNPGLTAGQAVQIYYVIIATDNDDPDGTRCDHSVESEVFATQARGGGATETYGYCHSCVSDGQCGGAEDLCVDLGGEAFCVVSCASGESCPSGQQCVLIQSVDERELSQCLPVDMNCGQRCLNDPFDEGARNDDEEHSTRLEAGVYAGMTICGEDHDFFSFNVAAGQSVMTRIQFSNAAGDLDMAMSLPGAFDEEGHRAYLYQSLSGDRDMEEVKEHCVIEDGVAFLWVGPYNHSQNTYDLTIEIGSGECDRVCEDDAYDRERSNSSIEDATFAELIPFEMGDLMLCPNDVDFYGFSLTAGEHIAAGIAFAHIEGNLDLTLFDSLGTALAGSYSFFDSEILEMEITSDGLYYLMVSGATPSAGNAYDMWVDVNAVETCEGTISCNPGTFCDGRDCVDASCVSGLECGANHACASSRVGVDPAMSGGECVDACSNDLECRVEAEYRCKRFEDFTRSCAQAGLGAVGSRCAGYQDCDGARVCFPAPGGYCAEGGCAPDLPCPEGTICQNLMGHMACVQRCEGDGECRAGEGYHCVDVGEGARACLPE